MKFFKIIWLVAVLFVFSCNSSENKSEESVNENVTQNQNDSVEPAKSMTWIDIQEKVSKMTESTTYNEIIEQLGEPYDAYVTPSLKDEYVMFYNVPGVNGAIYWIMIDSESKKFLYWSGEKSEKIRMSNP